MYKNANMYCDKLSKSFAFKQKVRYTEKSFSCGLSEQT